MPCPLLLALALAALLLPQTRSLNTAQLKAFQMGLTGGLYADREALLALKAIIPPGGYGTSQIKAGWPTSASSPNFNPCNATAVWPHVKCTQFRVVEINLSGLGVEGGPLPDELAQMSKLITLKLDSNKFSGTLPNAWGGPSAFTSLSEMRLNGNRLSGQLPAWGKRGAFRVLSKLYLAGNSFTGSLPATWANGDRPLRALTLLDLSGNALSGTLPDGPTDWGTGSRWGSPFPRLKTLNLDGNTLEGKLPDWGKQYAFAALEKLYLGNNLLSGTLPQAWGTQYSFPRLQELQLQWNNLGNSGSPGGLPDQWKRVATPRAFPALQTLVLFNGNEFICSPNDEDRLQGGASYNVKDAQGRVYEPGTSNWRICG